MNLVIEDSPRNVGSWITRAVDAGHAQGAVISPWATAWHDNPGPGRKPSARTRVSKLQDAGAEVWFDPMTHALQMPGVGDFRFYDEYDLWAGPRGDLSAPDLVQEHVARVFACQDTLGVSHLAPTVLLHTGLDVTSALALEIAQEAVRQDPDCRLTVAGTMTFWASGAALDAHVGALNGLAPSGWFVGVVRTATPLPVQPVVEEVHGLCRTARSLGEDAPVHVSHGDLAGLPAITAGAATVGTGWDQRQRVCSITDYGPRPPADEGGFGSWYERPTLRVLLGSLTPNEAAILQTSDAALAARLGGLPAPGAGAAFDHHVAVLSELLDQLLGVADLHARYDLMMRLYADAAAEWAVVERITRCANAAAEWVADLRSGLALYGHTEGW